MGNLSKINTPYLDKATFKLASRKANYNLEPEAIDVSKLIE